MEASYAHLNSSVLSQLKKALEFDPACDLEDTLQNLYTNYSVLRKNAEERAAKQAARRAQKVVSKPLPPPPPQVRSIVTFLRECISVSSLRNIVSLSVLALASLSISQESADDTQVTAVLDAIRRVLSSVQPLAVTNSKAIFPLDGGLLIKIGPDLDDDEVAALQYIEQSVPVVVAPRVHGYVELGKVRCLFFTRIPGETVGKSWPSLSKEQKRAVRDSLDVMLSALRKVELPDGSPFGSLSERHVCRDLRRVPRQSDDLVCTEEQFNKFLLTSHNPRLSPSYHSWLSSMLRTNHRIVLTHADLHPQNILVDIGSSGRVSTGLIDWKTAGFYPEYWEMVKFYNLRTVDDTSDWWDFLPLSIQGYDYELAIGKLLTRPLGS